MHEFSGWLQTACVTLGWEMQEVFTQLAIGSYCPKYDLLL